MVAEGNCCHDVKSDEIILTYLVSIQVSSVEQDACNWHNCISNILWSACCSGMGPHQLDKCLSRMEIRWTRNYDVLYTFSSNFFTILTAHGLIANPGRGKWESCQWLGFRRLFLPGALLSSTSYNWLVSRHVVEKGTIKMLSCHSPTDREQFNVHWYFKYVLRFSLLVSYVFLISILDDILFTQYIDLISLLSFINDLHISMEIYTSIHTLGPGRLPRLKPKIVCMLASGSLCNTTGFVITRPQG